MCVFIQEQGHSIYIPEKFVCQHFKFSAFRFKLRTFHLAEQNGPNCLVEEFLSQLKAGRMESVEGLWKEKIWCFLTYLSKYFVPCIKNDNHCHSLGDCGSSKLYLSVCVSCFYDLQLSGIFMKLGGDVWFCPYWLILIKFGLVMTSFWLVSGYWLTDLVI